MAERPGTGLTGLVLAVQSSLSSKTLIHVIRDLFDGQRRIFFHGLDVAQHFFAWMEQRSHFRRHIHHLDLRRLIAQFPFADDGQNARLFRHTRQRSFEDRQVARHRPGKLSSLSVGQHSGRLHLSRRRPFALDLS